MTLLKKDRKFSEQMKIKEEKVKPKEEKGKISNIDDKIKHFSGNSEQNKNT